MTSGAKPGPSSLMITSTIWSLHSASTEACDPGLTGESITDPTSGFRAANKRIIRLVAGEYPEDYPEVESLFLAHLAGLRVSEAPVSMRPRGGGRSSITPVKSAYYMIKVMMVLFVWLVRKKPNLEVT